MQTAPLHHSARELRIHLVRHGLSEANLDRSLHQRKPDHAIALAPIGHAQARTAGMAIAAALATRQPRRVRLLVSPYLRARQSAEAIAGALDEAGIVYDRREDLALREQSFGIFDGLPEAEQQQRYPEAFAYYRKHAAFAGEYFATIPLGESGSPTDPSGDRTPKHGGSPTGALRKPARMAGDFGLSTGLTHLTESLTEPLTLTTRPAGHF